MRSRRTGTDASTVGRRAAGVRWLVVIALLGSWPAADAASNFAVRYRDGALTVRIDRVPLDEVLDAVARETGMAIEGEPLDRRDVTKRFDAVPFARALRRLVGRQNFVLRYDADGAPVRLDLLGAPLARPVPVRQRSVNVLKLLVSQPPVTVPPRTARALGASRLPIHRVLAGLRPDDATVRAETASVLARTVEGTRDLMAAVVHMDAQELAQFVSRQAGAHAADVAAKLYEAVHDPRLRSRLSMVIATLQRSVG